MGWRRTISGSQAGSPFRRRRKVSEVQTSTSSTTTTTILGLLDGLISYWKLDEGFFTTSTTTTPTTTVATTTTTVVYGDEYQAVYDAMTTPPDAEHAGYQNTMVEALVAAGYWARMDLFYVFATNTNNNSEAYLNWINPTGDDNCTAGGGTVIFTAYEGFLGNGSDGWIDTNYNPSTEGINFTRDDGTIGIYCRVSNDEVKPVIGNADNTNRIIPHTSGSMAGRINIASSLSGVSANSQGLFVATRRTSTAMEIYRNGTSLASSNALTSVAVSNNEWTILRGSTSYSANQVSITFVMDQVSGAEELDIYNILQAYMTSLGTQV